MDKGNPCRVPSFSLAKDFPPGSDGEESACNAGDLHWIPGLGRSPGKGHGNPFQYSCPENPMDSRAWWTPVQGHKKLDMTEVT